MPRLDVIYEDNHLLVVNKPAGVATMGAAADTPSLAQWAKTYLKARYDKPGNVYLGIVSRLDKVVTGVIVFARTSKAAKRLNQQQLEHRMTKQYWALVPRLPNGQARGRLKDRVRKNEATRRMECVGTAVRDAATALLDYRLLARLERYFLLEVQLVTGRKHQIRVQLAAHGSPVVGDRKYGSHLPFPHGIALHSRYLGLAHPTRGESLSWQADPPGYWPAIPRGLLST